LTVAEVMMVPAMLAFTTSVVPKSIYKQALGVQFSVVGLATYTAMQLGALLKGMAFLKVFTLATILPVGLALCFLLFNERVRKLLAE
jgi:hypothetical protein